MNGRRFANLVLSGAALVALLGTFLISTGANPDWGGMSRRLPFIAALFVLASLLVAAMRLPVGARIALAMSLISAAVGIYAMEGFLRWRNESWVRTAARNLGNTYDSRLPLEVILDLRHAGVNAWPLVFPLALLKHPESDALFPLGGISSVTTVHCNEIGPYVIYRSDEHGFQNPPGAWKAGALEVAIVGDSNAQGNCVEPSQSAASRIRSAFPATLNLAMEGNGPLIELAAIREFLPELRPRRVLWVFCEGNDLAGNLPRERNNPILRQYLRPDFRQNLVARQDEVDALLKKRVSDYIKQGEAAVASKRSQLRHDFLEGWLRLRFLRYSIGQRLTAREPAGRVDLDLFRQILQDARDTVTSWQGRLFFVYLPNQAVFLDPAFARGNQDDRRRILSLLSDLDIPVIDLQPAFETVKDPNTLYASPGPHLNPTGYALMGKTIVGALKTAASGK
jgi:lysophospholipase L1-like esterase